MLQMININKACNIGLHIIISLLTFNLEGRANMSKMKPVMFFFFLPFFVLTFPSVEDVVKLCDSLNHEYPKTIIAIKPQTTLSEGD